MEGSFAYFSLGLAPRLVMTGGLYALGVMLQLLFPWGIVPGGLLILAGWLPLLLKKISNKPADRGLESWKAVSMTEIDRLADTLRQSRSLAMRTAGGNVLRVAAVVVLGATAALFTAFDRRIALAAADGLLFLVPALFFGRVRAYVPSVLAMKMPCFQAIFSESNSSSGNDAALVVTPYLRFDKDREDRDIPEDIRLMVEPRRKPDDLAGVQIQAAVNKGPNGQVPYLYAVILMKGRGATWKRLKDLDVRGYEVEAAPAKNGEEEYSSIVVRQQTGGGGYATRPSDCTRLFGRVRDILQEVSDEI